MQDRAEENPELVKRQNQIAEHSFHTIKHWNDQGCFLIRRLKNEKAEISLTGLA